MERNKENLLEEAENALIEFIIRVSKGNATCETEIAVLPQVANALLEYEIDKGKPKEIADLVVALQSQQKKQVKPPKIRTVVTIDGRKID